MSAFSRLLSVTARGVALFLGAFSLLNVAGELRSPGFDASEWWIDLRFLGHAPRAVVLALAGVALMACGLGRPRAGTAQRRRGTEAHGKAEATGSHKGPEAGHKEHEARKGVLRAVFASFVRTTAARQRAVTLAVRMVVALLLGVSLANTAAFYQLAASGALYHAFPVPFSLLVAAALALVLAGTYVPPHRPPPAGWGGALAVAGLCVVAFPMGQALCFGKTDYRRSADAIVVFGARAYADGTLSHALADRVRTGAALYQQGYAAAIVMSGGPGDGAVHETEAMRNFAVELGIPAEAIVLDRAGLSTDETVTNTAAVFKDHGIRSALAVSHYWHLPRVKMTYQRAGIVVYTVPAHETRPLAGRRRMLVREVVALWAYYLRALVR